MYPRYNIPQNRRSMQTRYSYPSIYQGNSSNNGDRFIGGGFIAPFLLGGIAGSLVTRPPIYGPPVAYYPPPIPYYNNNYYYYN